VTTLAAVDPATGETLRELPVSTSADVAAASTAAATSADVEAGSSRSVSPVAGSTATSVVTATSPRRR